MLRRYSFIFLFLFWVTGATWWAGLYDTPQKSDPSIAGPPALPSPSQELQTSKRREMIETLDRLVAYEHYYRAVYGHFTKLLGRIGFSIPASVKDFYEIRVAEASPDRLLIQALAEQDGRTTDLVSINEDYQVRSNFELPPPRADFLKVRAMKHLRELIEAPPESDAPSEAGVYPGYFRYEVRQDERKSAFAVGIRPPVVGVQIELNSNNLALDADDQTWEGWSEAEMDSDSMSTGQQPTGNVMSTLEEAYLAQRIFRGEMGRYARSWSELSRISAFRFERKDVYGINGVPFGDAESLPELDAGATGADASRHPASGGLVIEPISKDEMN